MSDVVDQPPPVANTSTPIWDFVIEDMRQRDHVGRQRYGTPLQAGNGRDALVDAYQEALDLVVYLKQAIVERDAARPVREVAKLHAEQREQAERDREALRLACHLEDEPEEVA